MKIMKLSNDIKSNVVNVLMEGTVSRILVIGPGYCFMKFRRK